MGYYNALARNNTDRYLKTYPSLMRWRVHS